MLLEKGEYKVPNLFNYLGYTIFFWANENYEPIHVHICKGSPTANATKVWLTKGGDCILEKNSSKIPKHDLNKLFKAIQYNYFYIISEWKNFYGVEDVKFYC